MVAIPVAPNLCLFVSIRGYPVLAPFERPVALAQQGGDSTMERITNAREKCSVESRTGLTT